MLTEYNALVSALKNLTQGESPNETTLPMAEDEWNTRPDTNSYGMVSLEFEADALRGDNIKTDTAYEGSVDLFSQSRDGGGWIEKITGTLTEYCDGAWRLNHRADERETRLFHWEWVFQIEG